MTLNQPNALTTPFALVKANRPQGPKLELKKVKTFRGREGYGLNAEIWVNDRKAAYIIDEGNGGMYRYDIHDKELWAILEAYAASLPPALEDITNGINLPMDVDMLIDEAFDSMQKVKEWNKMVKQMEFTIFWGVPSSGQYTGSKYKRPLAEIPREILQKHIDEQKAKFKEGEQFFNINFEALGLKA